MGLVSADLELINGKDSTAYQGVAILIQSKPILETNQVEDWRWSIEQKNK